jgi:nickel/cobalt transporter (NicO) family protein
MANEDRGKLKTLLGYWVEHNEEHSQEFKEWADKADAMGEKQVAGEIRQAVGHMEKVTEILTGTMNRLGEG